MEARGHPQYTALPSSAGNPPPPLSAATAATNSDPRANTGRKPDYDLLIFVFGFMTVMLLFYAPGFGLGWYAQRPPPFSLKFQVNNVSVSPFNVSNSPLTSNWSLNFTVGNLNEKTIHYERVTVSLFYEDQYYISDGNISPFSQCGKNEMVVESGLNAAVESVHVDDWVSQAIIMDMNALGAVEFRVYVDGIARTELGKDEKKKVRVGVSCEHVKIEFISNSTTVVGKMLGGSRKCHVDLRGI